jgi:16S rRNA C1402 (ribose-2'-O) methylase RsmI
MTEVTLRRYQARGISLFTAIANMHVPDMDYELKPGPCGINVLVSLPQPNVDPAAFEGFLNNLPVASEIYGRGTNQVRLVVIYESRGKAG